MTLASHTRTMLNLTTLGLVALFGYSLTRDTDWSRPEVPMIMGIMLFFVCGMSFPFLRYPAKVIVFLILKVAALLAGVSTHEAAGRLFREEQNGESAEQLVTMIAVLCGITALLASIAYAYQFSRAHDFGILASIATFSVALLGMPAGGFVPFAVCLVWRRSVRMMIASLSGPATTTQA